MKTTFFIGFLTFWWGVEKANASEINRDPINTQSIQNWVNEHAKYPAAAKDNKEEGTVYVEFTVNEGEIQEPRVIHKADEILNKAALELIKDIPTRILMNTNDTKYILPIKYDLI
jgi:TonB family protein